MTAGQVAGGHSCRSQLRRPDSGQLDPRRTKRGDDRVGDCCLLRRLDHGWCCRPDEHDAAFALAVDVTQQLDDQAVLAGDDTARSLLIGIVKPSSVRFTRPVELIDSGPRFLDAVSRARRPRDFTHRRADAADRGGLAPGAHRVTSTIHPAARSVSKIAASTIVLNLRQPLIASHPRSRRRRNQTHRP